MRIDYVEAWHDPLIKARERLACQVDIKVADLLPDREMVFVGSLSLSWPTHRLLYRVEAADAFHSAAAAWPWLFSGAFYFAPPYVRQYPVSGGERQHALHSSQDLCLFSVMVTLPRCLY